MSTRYNLLDAALSPVDLKEMKSYLKMSNINIDDSLIKTLISSATASGEQYTGRDFRVNSYELLLDSISEREEISSALVDSIVKIQYKLSGTFTDIDSTIYYLKNLQQHSEVILAVDKSWPTDGDDIEHGFRIEFKTKAWESIDQAKLAIYKHVAHLYLNRGDCKDGSTPMKDSGAEDIYDQFIIPRI